MQNKSYNLILASSSKIRKQLLEQIFYYPDHIIAPDLDETPLKKEKAKDLVTRISKLKAEKIWNNIKNKSEFAQAHNIIIAADTNATTHNKILEKTYDRDIAYQYLKKINGKRHRLYTGICVFDTKNNIIRSRTVMTILKLKRLSTTEINNYLLTNEWKGCSGGYSLDRSAAKFISWISGSYSNILGMPLYDINQMLMGLNIYPKSENIQILVGD